MKKLMIAVAAAAMIGGVEAAAPVPYTGIAYNFKATLKTTKAKNQSASTTYTVKMAMSGVTGRYWYTDTAEVSQWNAAYPGLITFDKNNVGKLNINKLTWKGATAAEKEAEKYRLAGSFKDYAALFIGKNDVSPADYTGIPEFYRGKETWCGNFNVKITDSDCYRVAGSESIKDIYVLDDCCDLNAFGFVDQYSSDGNKAAVGLGDIQTMMLYRFGSIMSDKANKVEFVGKTADLYVCDVQQELDGITYGPAFSLAGQGAWANLKDYEGDKFAGVKSISGNIVGIWWGAVCEVCCGLDGDALVWACDPTLDEDLSGDGLNTANNKNFNDTDPDPAEWKVEKFDCGTAAFGTFTMTYNQKLSDYTPAP